MSPPKPAPQQRRSVQNGTVGGAQLTYPFMPKSNAYLEPGMFWPVALEGGQFASGVVLGVPKRPDPHQPANSRIFVAGLLDWLGSSSPSEDDLQTAQLLDWGTAHVRSIDLTSGEVGIVGRLGKPLNSIAKVSHRFGGTVAVYVNGEFSRAASKDEAREMDVFGTWGLVYIRARAAHVLGAR